MRRVSTAGTIAAALISIILSPCLTCSSALAAAGNSALLNAQKEAESKGYVFLTTHDEIVSKAQQEGKLYLQSGFSTGTIQATSEVFRKKYPFIDLQVDPLEGSDVAERLLSEVQAGVAKWDIIRTAIVVYSGYLPHLWKADLLGMSQQRVLDIPSQTIDPKNRNVIALGNRFVVVVYNKNLVPAGQVPKSWEDMLKPEWKGKKFATDIIPQQLAALVPVWGLEKTLDYARSIAAQQPIWVRGGNRPLVALSSGEIPLLLFVGTYSAAVRAQGKDPLGAVQYSILEPVPVRFVLEHAILATAKSPHAALLWLEFMAGAEAQKLIDQHEPLAASLYRQGSAAEQALRGKKLSVVSWEHNEKMEQWVEKIVEALGFPRETK